MNYNIYMKKVVVILLVAALLVAGVFFYFQNKNSVGQKEKVLEDQTSEVEFTQEKTIGNMIFKYPEESIFLVDQEDFINLNTGLKSTGYNQSTGEKSVSNYTPIIFSISQNENPDQLRMKDWFEKNTPEQEKQSVYSAIEQGEVVIGGVTAYKVRYAADIQLTGGFYDLITLYIPHNTDIYEVSYYATPIGETDPSFSLDEDDIKNATEYMAIVEKVIKSIKFIN